VTSKEERCFCSRVTVAAAFQFHTVVRPTIIHFHAMRAAMLHQPRVPPTGQRQAVEIAIKWKEVLAQKNAMLEILSKTTGHSTTKLDKV
jgi:Clp protease